MLQVGSGTVGTPVVNGGGANPDLSGYLSLAGFGVFDFASKQRGEAHKRSLAFGVEFTFRQDARFDEDERLAAHAVFRDLTDDR